MKKKIIIISILIVLILLLTPIPLHYKDGGSVEYKALLYSVTKYNEIQDVSTTKKGISIKILNFKIYENTYYVNYN